VIEADVIATRLREVIDPGRVITDPDRTESYRRDHARLCAAGHPAAVVLPVTTAEVAAVLRLASQLGVPVVPQGARSGLSGAANAHEGGIVLGLEHMNAIRSINPPDRTVVVEPGVLNSDLSRAVAARGLFYPPDPSSSDFSTIGGNIATNAGGLCCLKYGVTRDYVLGLEVVLASGEIVRVGRSTVKGVAGLDLVSLIVGSEGTLGVVTEATLALRPAPSSSATIAATFTTTDAAARAAIAVAGGSVVPSLLEFMDATSLDAVNRVYGLELGDVAGLLLVETDSDPALAADQVAELTAMLEQAGAEDVIVAEDEAEAALLKMARRSAVTAFEQLGDTLVDDVCIPRSRLVELVSAVQETAADCGVTIGLVGHVGDGNFHPTIVFDQTDPSAVVRAERAFRRLMEIALELGGTITGEHGVGLLKTDMLLQESGPVSLRLQRGIKAAFDPLGILNPGKVYGTPVVA
jgi:glycolate oxidase